jgi:hypothetical protein
MQIVTAATTGAPSLIEQRIEAVNAADLVNGTYITVSFWAIQTSGTAFTLNTQLGYPTAADTFTTFNNASTINEVRNTLTSSWAFYTATFQLNSASVATNGLAVQFWALSISTSVTFNITGVQLEKGQVATPYEFRPYTAELALCQRYYYQLTSPLPGTPFPTQILASFGTAVGIGSTGFWLALTMPVPMRPVSYAITTSTPASSWQIFNGASIAVASISAQTDSYTPTTLILNCTAASSTTAGAAYIMRTNTLTGTTIAYIGVSAEL